MCLARTISISISLTMYRLTRIKKEPIVSIKGRSAFRGKMFVVGLSGTGTRSLHHAFRLLGIKARHYPRSPEDFDNFQALSDIPVTCRYRILDELYPGAKFIHTIRDLDSWLGSRRRKPEDRNPPSFWIQLNRMVTYNCLRYDEDKLRIAHARWTNEITEYFEGRDNCLTMDILNGDGWEKLCPFIDAVLDEPVAFPNVKTLKAKKE